MSRKLDKDSELLASLGYKQEFTRAFSPLEVFGLTFSVFGLLPSIASVLVYAIHNGGTSAMIWGWAVASIFLLCIGMAMAELASSAPVSGGLYYWTHKLYSPNSRNLLSWIVGYANTIGNIAGIASINWGFAVQLTAAAAIGSNGAFIATTAQTFGIYVAAIISEAIICCFGTRILARLQNVYITMNILLCLVVIIGLPIATPKEYKNTAKFAFGEFSNFNDWPNGFAFILSFLAPMWTIGAFDSAVHISEEASNASTAVPWGIVSAILVSGVLGWAINIVLAFCMGPDLDIVLNSDIGQPMAQIFFQSFGQKGTLAIWAIVVIVQYMMGSSMVLAASRQSFAFARDGALPFSGWLYRMNRYTRTPINTVAFTSALAICLGILAFAGEQAIGAVFSLGVAALYIAYSIPMAGRLFGNKMKPGPFNLGIFSIPITLTAILYMSFMVVVLLFPTMPDPDVEGMNFAVVVLGGTLLLSVVYFYFPRYGGKTWFTGPIHTIDTVSVPLQTDDTAEGSEKQDSDVHVAPAVTA